MAEGNSENQFNAVAFLLIQILVKLLRQGFASATRCAFCRAIITDMVVATPTFVPFSRSFGVHDHHGRTVSAGISVGLKVFWKPHRSILRVPVVNLKIPQSGGMSLYKHACPMSAVPPPPPDSLNVAIAACQLV